MTRIFKIRKPIFATLLTILFMVYGIPAFAEETGVILVSELRMRSGPGKDYRIVSHLPKGAKVPVIAHQGDWLKIVHKNQEGFILNQAKFIKINHPVNAGTHKTEPKLKDSKVNAETIKRQLHEAESELASITQKEKEVLEAFNTADEALSDTRRQVRVAKASLAEVRKKIKKAKKQTGEVKKKIQTGERYAAKRLTALYKINWVGKIHLLATADSFFDFAARKNALEKIIAQDERLLTELNRNKTDLEALLAELQARRTEKRALEKELRERATKLSAQQKRRKKLLLTIRSKKSLELAAIKNLRQAAMELNATIERIEPVKPKKIQPKRPANNNKPFRSYKGLLSWPVKGKIISFFGPYKDKKYKVTGFQSGINIQAERGEPIRSVSDGHVIFSSWFKGFGNMMIIDHGHHYYTVYAHLEEVFKVKGDRVDKNEVIATVGDSGSMTGPALHFEVRHHGKPVDPLKWIRRG